MKLEIHVHTRYSKDSLLFFWPLYLKCRLLHINGIAITEHNNIDGGIKFSEFCKRRGDKLKVIVGEEIFTLQGEVIGLFLKKQIQPGLSAEETIRQIRAQGAFVYIPHPYDQKRVKTVLREEAIAENKDYIDCMEIHNGRNASPLYDSRQMALAKKYNIPPVIGSDAHTFLEIGRNYMVLDKIPVHTESLKKGLISAKFYQKRCIKGIHQITRIVKLLKICIRGDYNALYRAITRKVGRGM